MDRNNKMLIDASHPEETRVVVLRNGRVEEFDFESAARKLLRGNVYLAKVTRVEPSLQAAFVDYGGNRHGFLAFNEIHPDYYQIPVADREALKQEELEAEADEDSEHEERQQRRGRRDRDRGRDRQRRGGGNGHHGDRPRGGDDHGAAAQETSVGDAGHETRPEGDIPAPADHIADERRDVAPEVINGDIGRDEAHDHVRDTAEPQTPRDDEPKVAPLTHDAAPGGPADDRLTADAEPRSHDERHSEPADERGEPSNVTDVPEPIGNVEDQGVIEINGGNGEAEAIEEVTTEEDALEELPDRPRRRSRRQYKIQEVIKRRQIILVQVVKEERGNKGAALTTYISLAGRYTVLMPNTGRGGGISRKITQPQDRKRLKAIADDLDVAEGMGLIIRTAGAARTMQEIKRDYEYLLRLWESVRDLTLSSTAPCLVYEEGNLIKRSIRDLYSKDVDGVVVSGEVAHREARDFMTMLMPGHGDQVQRYDGSEPLFTRYGIERQLNALFSPYVNLRSGGYLVINQTEALVAVDVNSGKSTREFSIEETALNTNLEAAEEIARQLKLRDLAGLIVVDFIDMEEKRNNRSVERRLKDSLRHDRARIQIGRISHFGLMEMSRQRLRTGMLEGSTSQCPHCQGTGIIRSVESVALAVLRGLEDNLMKQPSSLSAVTTAEVALYILNHKRNFIIDMEARHGIAITIDSSDRMQGANFAIERTAAAPAAAKPEGRGAVSMDWGFDDDEAAGSEGGNGHAAAASERHDEHEGGRGHRHSHSGERGGERHGRGERGRGEHGRGENGRGGRDHERGRDRDRGRDRPHDHDHDRHEPSLVEVVNDDDHGHDDVVEVGDADTGGNGEGGRSSRRRRRRRGRRGSEGGERHGGQRPGFEAGGDDQVTASADDVGAPVEQDNRPFDAAPAIDEPSDHVETIGTDDGVSAGEGGEREPMSDRDENGDRQRRGRRRGRRGGRGRGREGQGSTAFGAPGSGGDDDTPESNWGIAEIARPGADQPDGPPAAVATSWDGGFVPASHAPVPAPIPREVPVPVERIASDDKVIVAAEIATSEPTPLVERVPIAENKAPVMEPVASVEPVVVAPIAAPIPAPIPAPASVVPPPAAAPVPVPEEPARPARKGWWNRKFGGE